MVLYYRELPLMFKNKTAMETQSSANTHTMTLIFSEWVKAFVVGKLSYHRILFKVSSFLVFDMFNGTEQMRWYW